MPQENPSEIRVPWQYGFLITFADGKSMQLQAYTAEVAKVWAAHYRTMQGACTRHELEVVSVERIKDLDLYRES